MTIIAILKPYSIRKNILQCTHPSHLRGYQTLFHGVNDLFIGTTKSVYTAVLNLSHPALVIAMKIKRLWSGAKRPMKGLNNPCRIDGVDKQEIGTTTVR